MAELSYIQSAAPPEVKVIHLTWDPHDKSYC
jgi:hypothetical protein